LDLKLRTEFVTSALKHYITSGPQINVYAPRLTKEEGQVDFFGDGLQPHLKKCSEKRIVYLIFSSINISRHLEVANGANSPGICLARSYLNQDPKKGFRNINLRGHLY
jgi:hypothetical protein